MRAVHEEKELTLSEAAIQMATSVTPEQIAEMAAIVEQEF